MTAHYTIMNDHLVNIVIPLYKAELTADEQKSLAQCFAVLSRYPITLVKPASLDISLLVAMYPSLNIESFNDDFFGSIFDYNRLMMSSDFYERFIAYKYLLIYQLDAYVFNDELETWCLKDYDYIGAPWLLKAKYQSAFFRPWLELKSLFYRLKGKPARPKLLGNKVGNGGFSLRKVASHLAITQQSEKTIQHFLEKSRQHTEFNEDVFWATQTPEFKIPNYNEAVAFAFDLHPERSLALNHNRLPFGCHGWYKDNRKVFWQKYIS